MTDDHKCASEEETVEREYPRVETVEDLWCWLNTWGNLRKYVPRSSDQRLAEAWRKGYEQCISDAMKALEQAGVTFDTVPRKLWHRWSRRG